MRRKECDIVRDLLPSYVDKICSETSKLWIEEHLADCEECRNVVETMSRLELSANKLEAEGMEAAKKWKKKLQRKSLAGYGLCLGLILFLMGVFGYHDMQIPLWVLYGLLPVSMIATKQLVNVQTVIRNKDRWDGLCFAGALLATGYGIFMIFFGFHCAVAAGTLFSMPLTKVGPFLYGQMTGVAVLLSALYFVQFVRTQKQGKTRGDIVPDLCLTGIFLMMAYGVQMGYLSDVNTAFNSLVQATILICGIGIAVLVGQLVLERCFKKR